MYKWHVNSAVGRSRPVAAADLARVADGIADSLRAFSISAGRCADDVPKLRIHRASTTFKEVSSLAPKPKSGVDARSLAAKAPTFRIHRVDMSAPNSFRSGIGGGGGGGGGGGYPNSGERPHSPNYRGRAGLPRDLAAGGRGGAGRGGFMTRGSGGRGGRGADRGGRGGRPLKPKKKKLGPKDVDDQDYVERPMTEEENDFLNARESGQMQPYEPDTSLESLRGYGAAGLISARNVKEQLITRLGNAVASESATGGYTHGIEHLYHLSRGGIAQFETNEQREITQAFLSSQGEEAMEQLQSMGVNHVSSQNVQQLSEAQKEEILGEWVAGRHVGLKDGDDGKGKGAVLNAVTRLARRNGTYLPRDAQKFEERLRTLVPGMTRARGEAVVKTPF